MDIQSNSRVIPPSDSRAYDRPMKLKDSSKVILIVRNPFEALISYFQLTVTGSHTKSVLPLKFKTQKWGWFVKYAKLWSDHVHSWIR